MWWNLFKHGIEDTASTPSPSSLQYKPPAQDETYILNSLSQIIDYYSITYEKQAMELLKLKPLKF